ncbi:hypothetical protein NEOKW01_1069 [Nematocida sp. AWRm80]|nr:hypothetical protein NEOKW01_1069 [Nematocida sp. AWRm80]
MTQKNNNEPSDNNLRKKIEMQYKQEERAPEYMKIERPRIGLQIKKILITHYVKAMQGKRERGKTMVARRECGFCKTQYTSLWRRIGDLVVCNACGLYYKLHGKIRDKIVDKNKKFLSYKGPEEKENKE